MTTRPIHTKVIRKLLYQRRLPANPVPLEEAVGWFPGREREEFERVLGRMAADPDVPLSRVADGTTSCICLQEVEVALRYLDEHGGRVPFGLDAFLQSPPLNESRI